MTKRSRPMAKGFSPTLSWGSEFLESVMANIPNKRMNVPITCGKIKLSHQHVSLNFINGQIASER